MPNETTRLREARARVEDATVLAHCSAKGVILDVDASPGVDESLVGDVVASAASFAAQAEDLVGSDDITTVVVGRTSAVAARRLKDGSWLSMLVNDPSSLGLALETLAALEA